MRNLKRALSLAMASVMLLGMMVVGAGAAKFPDSDKIKNADAVNTLVALNILKGKDDGKFDPEGIVTRAEMAKMICVALNGGKDPKLTGGGLYADTKGHWASGYIDYCTNLKIVAGDNKGKFNPNATVTGTEAAKMILIAIGYSAENEKFVNDANWSININVKASGKDLYKGLAMNAGDGLTRDAAAQMLYNGMQAKMIRYDYQLNTVNGNLTSVAIAQDIAKTILSDKFSMITEYSYLCNTTYNDNKKEYTYAFDTRGVANAFGPTITADALAYPTLKSDKDYSELYGMKVKVLYKIEDSKKVVYGMYPSDSSVLAAGMIGKATIKANTLKFDGVTYDKNAGCTAVAFNTTGAVSANNEYSFKAIDNNDDNKIDVIVVLPFAPAKVTFVGKDSVTAGNVSYKFADCNIYEGIAKDDRVVITAKANSPKDMITIAKAEKLTGAITAVNADGDWRIDGTWYSPAGAVVASLPGMTAGDNVDIYTVNGYIISAEVNDSTALTDVLYVAATDVAANTVIAASLGKNEGVKSRVFLSDGTNSIVKTMRVDVTTVSSGVSAADTDLKKVVPAEGLYTYKLNKDNVYELKAVKASGVATLTSGLYAFAAANLPNSTTLGAASTADATYNKTNGKIGTSFIADDAVVYLVKNDTGAASGAYDKAKVVSGKDLKTMSNYGDNAVVLTKAVSGLSTVKVAVLYDNAAFGGTNASTGYGYITSAGYAEKNVNSDWVIKFTAWTKDGAQELTAVDSGLSAASAGSYAKGSFITYTNTVTTGEVTDMRNLLSGPDTLVDGMETAITGYDNDKNIAFDGTAAKFKDNSKSVVIFVDTANKKGIEGGSIEMAQKLASGVYVKNAVAMVSTSDGVDVLFVDTANKLAGATYTIAVPTAYTTPTVNGISAIANDATVTSAKGGATVDLKFTTTGATTAATQTKIVATLTLGDATTMTVTKTIGGGVAAGNMSMSFEMPYQAITGIVFTMVNVTPAP